jgi:hypothetical protein
MAAPDAWLRRAEWAGGVAVLLAPALYLGMFAGDAAIHLAFAERAALGAPFEFNPGEPVAGVTSPAYMWLLASAARVFGLAPLPIFAKAFDLAAWWGFVFLFWRLAQRVLGDRAFALLAALALGLMPGSFYNATIGMENGLFALVVILVPLLAVRHPMLGPGPTYAPRADFAVAAVIGAAFWLRPEAALVGALWFPARLFTARRDRRALAVVVGAAALCLTLAAALLAVHHHYTGAWLPASGRARIVSGMRRATWVGSYLRVSSEFALRLGAYGPLTLLALAFGWRLRGRRDGLAAPERRVLLWLLALFAAGFVAYSGFLGTAHLARYVIFLWPGLVLAAAAGARSLWSALAARPRLRGACAGALAAALAGVYGYEAMQRLSFGGRGELLKYVRAPAERRAFSDRWLAALEHPRKRPVVVALVEIQARYRADDRFLIRSLDGRSDPRFLDFVRGDFIDYEAYLRTVGVDFVTKTAGGKAEASRE